MKFRIVATIGLISCLLFLNFLEYYRSPQIIPDEEVETGLTPEQTWDIIYGEDVGEVLNLNECDNGGS